MLLLKVLQDESRTSLRMHGGLVGAFIQVLRSKCASDSEGGQDITRYELADALMTATSMYQLRAVQAISAEVERDYRALDPLTMERGMPPRQGRQQLLER